MSWPYWRPVLDRLSAVLSEPGRVVPAEASPTEGAEPATPSPAEWASVASRAAPKITVPYTFTEYDAAAEDRVLGELAALTAVMPPWQAADHLFNTIGDVDDVA